MGGAAALLALTAFAQHRQRRSIEGRLEAIAPQHELIVGQTRQLGTLQLHLQTATADADLFTYLRHPWPRTRILAELLARLPDEVTFTRVEITSQAPSDRGPARQRSRTDQEQEEARAASLPPASRDLKRLRDENDAARTVVTLTGATTESAALHRYLGTLEKSKLFSKVELSDIETSGADPGGNQQFSVVLTVRPGYGQPGGPAGPGPGRSGSGRVAQTGRRAG